jgi:hypothetical protein
LDDVEPVREPLVGHTAPRQRAETGHRPAQVHCRRLRFRRTHDQLTS